MPKHSDVLVPKREWTILTDSTDASITGVRLQNLGDYAVRIQAKADADPAGLSIGGALILREEPDIIFSTDTLATLFPGVTSPLHLFAYCANGSTEISVSHA